MKVLGLIPARGGSKRVNNKNTRLLNGKPLIAYTIEAALQTSSLSSVIVSTDSTDIKSVAKDFGADVPFIRPAEMATDTAGEIPLIIHALEWLQLNRKESYDAVVYLRPTAPLRTATVTEDVINAYKDWNCDAVRSVTLVEGVHHPYWMYFKNDDNKALPFDPEHTPKEYYRSQLLPPVYRLNGVVDILNTKNLYTDEPSLYGDDMRIYELNQQYSFDIDTEDDFKLCELMMQL